MVQGSGITISKQNVTRFRTEVCHVFWVCINWFQKLQHVVIWDRVGCNRGRDRPTKRLKHILYLIYLFLLIVIARQWSLKKRVFFIKFNNPIRSEEVLCQPKLRMYIQRFMSALTWPVQRSLSVCLVEMWYLASGSRKWTERVTCVIQWKLKTQYTFCSTDHYIAILDKRLLLKLSAECPDMLSKWY